jgi:hypothetical protein
MKTTLSRAQWSGEVERMYGWIAYCAGEPRLLRAMRSVLLSRPAYCVGVVLNAIEQGRVRS